MSKFISNTPHRNISDLRSLDTNSKDSEQAQNIAFASSLNINDGKQRYPGTNKSVGDASSDSVKSANISKPLEDKSTASSSNKGEPYGTDAENASIRRHRVIADNRNIPLPTATPSTTRPVCPIGNLKTDEQTSDKRSQKTNHRAGIKYPHLDNSIMTLFEIPNLLQHTPEPYISEDVGAKHRFLASMTPKGADQAFVIAGSKSKLTTLSPAVNPNVAVHIVSGQTDRRSQGVNQNSGNKYGEQKQPNSPTTARNNFGNLQESFVDADWMDQITGISQSLFLGPVGANMFKGMELRKTSERRPPKTLLNGVGYQNGKDSRTTVTTHLAGTTIKPVDIHSLKGTLHSSLNP